MSNFSNSVGDAVAEEMGKVLECPPLAHTDDFFVCGGDSLRAVALISQLVERWQQKGGKPAEKLQSDLLVAVFENPTPKFLAHVIEQHLSPGIASR